MERHSAYRTSGKPTYTTAGNEREIAILKLLARYDLLPSRFFYHALGKYHGTRKALTLLQNRQLYIERLFFNEYVPQNSYYSGGIYENESNPKNEYDPQAALALLAEAGWNSRDAQGRLVKNGQPLNIDTLNQQLSDLLGVLPQDAGKTRFRIHVSTDDPLDLFHAQRVAHRGGVEIHEHERGGHLLVKTLRNRGLLQPMLLRALGPAS